MPIHNAPQTTNLIEVLEKILDKGVVIVGDIKISLADVDLLTIKIRLLVASVDKAREIGMDWWEKDSYYSSKSRVIEEEHALLKKEINHLEQQLNEVRALAQRIEKKPLQQVYIEGESQQLEAERLSQAVEEGMSKVPLEEKIDLEIVKDIKQDSV
jgi:hypothetical protein